jgi:bifunctional non-homologous end joining protein LigD
MSTTLGFGNRTVEITHPDKGYFPDDNLTKGDLVDYYRRVAEIMLPYLRNRPVTLHRYPDGIEGEDFYQQQRPDHLPDWVGGVLLERRGGGSVRHTVVDGPASLAAVINTGCITLHAWLSRADRPERPDQMVFDLDPPSADDFESVRFAARRLSEVLDEIGLRSLVKTTGSRGLHVVVPLQRQHLFDEVRDFATRVAEFTAGRHSDRLTTAHRKQQRKGRLYLDVQRNAYGQHAVAAYSVRALPRAPVATPLAWPELGKIDAGPRRWTVGNLFRRLGQRDDPWQGAWSRAQTLAAPRKLLSNLNAREG